MTATTTGFRYRLHSTGGSSVKYGPCEVCGQHATEVFHQTEETSYEGGWTQYGCRSVFGHKDCLTQQQRGDVVTRMKWTLDEQGRYVSDCGRFVVSLVCRNPKWSGYWGLTDTKTGTEYPCRTEASAKTGARNLRNKAA